MGRVELPFLGLFGRDERAHVTDLFLGDLSVVELILFGQDSFDENGKSSWVFPREKTLGDSAELCIGNGSQTLDAFLHPLKILVFKGVLSEQGEHGGHVFGWGIEERDEVVADTLESLFCDDFREVVMEIFQKELKPSEEFVGLVGV